MKYLVDLSCPTDVYLFKGLIGELERRNHDVFVVTRTYLGGQMRQLTKHAGVDAVEVGSHGGKNLYDKLQASAERIQALCQYLKRDVGLDGLKGVVSNSNPETCRVGFGLGVDVYTWNDSPDLQAAQTRLTAPLSTWIFTPWLVPQDYFLTPGYGQPRVFPYRALFPMAWLPDIKIDDRILHKWGLDAGRPVVAFRESETQSAYLGEEDVAVEAVKGLAAKHPDWQFVTRVRYDLDVFKRKIGAIPPNVRAFTEAVDLHSFLATASLLVGGGGSMNIEAAYYGTPVISTRARTAYYETYLAEKGLAYLATTAMGAVDAAEALVGKRMDARIFREMKYPLGEIVAILEEK